MSTERGFIRWAPAEWVITDHDGNVVKRWTAPVEEVDDDDLDDDE